MEVRMKEISNSLSFQAISTLSLSSGPSGVTGFRKDLSFVIALHQPTALAT